MSKEAFTVRADSKKVKQLDELADKMDRSRNYLVNQAIDQLLKKYMHGISSAPGKASKRLIKGVS